MVCVLAVSQSVGLMAQRIGFVDSQEIYKNLPEYQKAATDLEKLANNWKREILEKQKELDQLQYAFYAEKPLLTTDMQQERLLSIRKKDDELREFQNNRFGYKGMYFLKQEEDIKPIKERVTKAIERVSKIKKVDFMFDVSADLVIPYANNARDYTKDVIDYLLNSKVN